MTDNLNLNWEEIIAKEARGINDADLGEVEGIIEDYVITKKGIVDKSSYFIPKNLVSHFDRYNLVFNITEYDSSKYKQ